MDFKPKKHQNKNKNKMRGSRKDTLPRRDQLLLGWVEQGHHCQPMDVLVPTSVPTVCDMELSPSLPQNQPCRPGWEVPGLNSSQVFSRSVRQVWTFPSKDA